MITPPGNTGRRGGGSAARRLVPPLLEDKKITDVLFYRIQTNETKVGYDIFGQ